jgi:hypothetical protein
MEPKFVIFVFISTFLIAAIYSSSLSFVLGEQTLVGCSSGGKGNFRTCITADDQGGTHIWQCTTIDKKWTCQYVEPVPRSNIPPSLTDALNTATQESENATKDTKGPNTDLLTGESLVESQNTTDGNDNTKPPKDLGGLNDEDLPEPDQ